MCPEQDKDDTGSHSMEIIQLSRNCRYENKPMEVKWNVNLVIAHSGEHFIPRNRNPES